MDPFVPIKDRRFSLRVCAATESRRPCGNARSLPVSAVVYATFSQR